MKSAEEIFVYLFFLPLHEVILKNSCKRVESQSILLRSNLGCCVPFYLSQETMSLRGSKRRMTVLGVFNRWEWREKKPGPLAGKWSLIQIFSAYFSSSLYFCIRPMCAKIFLIFSMSFNWFFFLAERKRRDTLLVELYKLKVVTPKVVPPKVVTPKVVPPKVVTPKVVEPEQQHKLPVPTIVVMMDANGPEFVKKYWQFRK